MYNPLNAWFAFSSQPAQVWTGVLRGMAEGWAKADTGTDTLAPEGHSEAANKPKKHRVAAKRIKRHIVRSSRVKLPVKKVRTRRAA